MDRHDAADVAPEDVYAAHLLDLAVQEKYGVHYLTYWMDPERGNIFCLVDAPDTDAAMAVHKGSARSGRKRDHPCRPERRLRLPRSAD